MAVMAVAWLVRMDKVLPMPGLEVRKAHQVYTRPEVTAKPLPSARVATVLQEQRVVRAAEAGMGARSARVLMAVAPVVRGMYFVQILIHPPVIFLLIPIIFSLIR